DCEANEWDRWERPKQYGNEPADATEKDHAPDSSEQDCLFLDFWDEPEHGESQSKPHSTEKSQIAIE
ncbi:MAG: hypothetical protein WBE69_23000, partial [Candidatus Binataceae bacterium]